MCEYCRFYGVDASAQHEVYKFKELTFNLLKLATTRSIGDFVPWLKWVITVSGLKSRMMKVKARADVVLQEFLEVKKNGKIINMKNDDVLHCEDFADVLMAQAAEDGTGHLSDNSIKAVIQVNNKNHVHPHLLLNHIRSSFDSWNFEPCLSSLFVYLVN
jgi:hypothetical protein